MIVTEREAETQAEGETGSMHWEPDMGFDTGSPGSRPGPKAGAKPLRHPGIPVVLFYASPGPGDSVPHLGLHGPSASGPHPGIIGTCILYSTTGPHFVQETLVPFWSSN